jgi:hypothetical protein
MAWTQLGSGDRLTDIFNSDGSRSVELTIDDGGGNPTTYSSDNTTIADGAMRAKLAKATGGTDVTVSFDLDGGIINAVKYEFAF